MQVAAALPLRAATPRGDQGAECAGRSAGRSRWLNGAGVRTDTAALRRIGEACRKPGFPGMLEPEAARSLIYSRWIGLRQAGKSRREARRPEPPRPDRRGGNQQRRWRLPFIGDQRHSCCASGSGSGSGDQ